MPGLFFQMCSSESVDFLTYFLWYIFYSRYGGVKPRSCLPILGGNA